MPQPGFARPNRSAVADYRRAQVARLLLRGLSQSRIAAALPKLDPPCVNPKNGKPWSVNTISNDGDVLREQWRADALGDTWKHRGRLLAEAREARAVAWVNKDVALVYKGLEIEKDLLGLSLKKDMVITDPEAHAKAAMQLALAEKIERWTSDDVVRILSEIGASRTRAAIQGQVISVAPSDYVDVVVSPVESGASDVVGEEDDDVMETTEAGEQAEDADDAMFPINAVISEAARRAVVTTGDPIVGQISATILPIVDRGQPAEEEGDDGT